MWNKKKSNYFQKTRIKIITSILLHACINFFQVYFNLKKVYIFLFRAKKKKKNLSSHVQVRKKWSLWVHSQLVRVSHSLEYRDSVGFLNGSVCYCYVTYLHVLRDKYIYLYIFIYLLYTHIANIVNTYTDIYIYTVKERGSVELSGHVRAVELNRVRNGATLNGAIVCVYTSEAKEAKEVCKSRARKVGRERLIGQSEGKRETTRLDLPTDHRRWILAVFTVRLNSRRSRTPIRFRRSS